MSDLVDNVHLKNEIARGYNGTLKKEVDSKRTNPSETPRYAIPKVWRRSVEN